MLPLLVAYNGDMWRYLRSGFQILWASPYTLLGLLIGVLLRGEFHLVAGVIEIQGPRIAWLLKRLPVSAAAITLGHVVLGRSQAELNFTRAHERVHVRQFGALGPLMAPAYFASSLYQWLRGGHFYYDNFFEKQAFSVEEESTPAV